MLAQADGHVRCGSCQKVFSTASQVSPITDNVEFEGYFEDLAYAVDDITPVQPGQIDSADWLDDELIALAELDAERALTDDELPEIDDDIFREIDSELNSLLADQVVSNEDDYPEAQGDLTSPLDSSSHHRASAPSAGLSSFDYATSSSDDAAGLEQTGSDYQASAMVALAEPSTSELKDDEADKPSTNVDDETSEYESESDFKSLEPDLELDEHEQSNEITAAPQDRQESLDKPEGKDSPKAQERQEPTIGSEFFADLKLNASDDTSSNGERFEDINFSDIPTVEVLSQTQHPFNDDAELEELDVSPDPNEESSSDDTCIDDSSRAPNSADNLDEARDREDLADLDSQDAINPTSITDDSSAEDAIIEESVSDKADSQEADSQEADSEDSDSQEANSQEADSDYPLQPEPQHTDNPEVATRNESIAAEDNAELDEIDDGETAHEVELDESIRANIPEQEETLPDSEYEHTNSYGNEDDEAEYLQHDDEYQPHLAEMDLQLEKRSRLPTVLWSSTSLLLIVILGAQIAWLKLPTWSAIEQYRPYYQQACELIKCELPIYDDVKAIEIIAFDIEADNTAGLLNVNISLRNSAAFSQRAPGLQLEFSSASGIPVATLNYDISQLVKTDSIDRLEPNEIIQLQLYVADPGDIATNYQAYIVKN